ncbi:MAG: hypothetical protein U9R50_05565 [Campylobacterota bacterium]|nr:hypothetical protein [Campylobacterota bacterium]
MFKIILAIVLVSGLLQAKASLYKMSDCFGKTRYVSIDPDTIVSMEPAKCTDKNGVKVFRIIIKKGGYRPYLLNENELASLMNNDEMIERDMKAQEAQMLRKQLMLDQ